MRARFAGLAVATTVGLLLARCSACTGHGGDPDADVRDTYVAPSPQPDDDVHQLPPGAYVPPDPECFDQGIPACCACGTCTCHCTGDADCDDANACTKDHCGFAANTFACEHRARECPSGMACHRYKGTCEVAPYGGCDPEAWYDECPEGTLCNYDTGLCEEVSVEPYCLPPFADAWCPCTEDDDCASSLCVDGPDGKVCTQFCVDTCPREGWACLVDPGSCPDCTYVCQYQPSRLCRPCATDADCNPTGSAGRAACAHYPDGGSYCGLPCDVQACPAGYTCAPVPAEVDGAPQCVSDSATCSCDAGAIEAAAWTTCTSTNDLGTCTGRRTCTAEGLTACDAPTPADEACNGLDDDCDGATDEGFADSDADGVPDCMEAQPCFTADPDADCDGDAVPNGQDVCPQHFDPSQEDWDHDGVGNACDTEVYLPVQLDVLWMGYYADTAAYLATLAPEVRGPEVTVDGGTLTVRWKAAVFEDCRTPDAFERTGDGTALTLRLVDVTCDETVVNPCLCADSDVVADVTASFELAPGTYQVTVACAVSGFWTACGEGSTIEVVVPGP